MTSIVFREVLPTEDDEPLDTRRFAPTQSTTNHHLREADAQKASEGHEKPYSRHKLAKGRGKRSAGGFRSGIYWVLLSVLIPALIVSVLRILCKPSASVSRGLGRGMSTRRLSVSEDISHGDPTLSQIIEECAAMEADLGLSLSERSNSYHGLDAAQEVERIAFALYQEALAFENKMQQTKSARQPIFPSLPSSPASQHQHLKGAANNTGQKGAGEGYQFSPSELTTAQDYWRVRLPEPSPSSTLPLGIASQPIFSSAPPAFRPTPPSAWLQQGVYASPQPDVGAYRSVGGPQPLVAAGYSVGLLPQAAALLPEDADRRYSRKRRRIGASQVVYSEVDPDLWLDAAPMIDGSPEGKRKSQSPSPQGLSPEQAAPGLCSARQVPTGKANLRDAGQGTLAKVSASSVWEASAAAPAASGAATSLQADSITAHPYVRLPALQEGVEPPHIWLWASNFWTSNGLSLDQILLSFRRVFTKHELNQLDATLLGEYVQELAVASAARARGTKRMNRPLHGSVIIGRQFLVLDAIVSAMHVFGVSTAACSWWRPFIDCFDTNYRYNEPQRLTRNSGRVNIDLANRMLAAISIYKKGERPDPEEIIDIKQTLFFSPYTPSRFRSPRWDPWRIDHLLFEEQNPEISEWLRKRQPILD